MVNRKRTSVINLRVTPQEKDRIEYFAKKCGLSVSEYLRQLAYGYAPCELPTELIKDLQRMPLVGGIRERLLTLKEQQKNNRKICGDCYNTDFLGYVFVDEMGNLYKPNTVSDAFQSLIKKHGLRKIRFHDIRHSCASLLLKNGVNLKLIQEWLGHSDISTTMNIYAHLNTSAKDVSANTMSQALSLPEYNGGYGWQRT